MRLYKRAFFIAFILLLIFTIFFLRGNQKQFDFDHFSSSTFLKNSELVSVNSQTKSVSFSSFDQLLEKCGMPSTSEGELYFLINGRVNKELHFNLMNKPVPEIKILDYPSALHDFNLIITTTNREHMCSLDAPILIENSTSPIENDVLFPIFVDKSNKIDNKFVEAIRENVLKNLVLVPKKSLPFSLADVTRSVVEKNSIDRYRVLISLKGDKTIELPIENDLFWIKLDEKFNTNSFLWDDSFVAWFVSDTDPVLSMLSLDFWYDMQVLEGKYKGLIPREIRLQNLANNLHSLQQGQTLNPVSYHLLNSPQINNPFFASRVELEIYKKTQDTERLSKLLPIYVNYFEFIEREKHHPNTPFYSWQNAGSGMDNTPRCLTEPCGYSDLIAQQAALANDIVTISHILGNQPVERTYQQHFLELQSNINTSYYNPADGFIYDAHSPENLGHERTLASTWSLYGDILSPEKRQKFIEGYLLSPSEFGGVPPLPSLSRSSAVFSPQGEYWQGGIWPPLIWITLNSLTQTPEEHTLSYQISKYYFHALEDVYTRDGTLYEYYAPTLQNNQLVPGKNPLAKSEFYGWGSLPLKLYFFLGCDKQPSNCIK